MMTRWVVAGVAGLGGMVSGIIAWRAVGFAGGTLLRVLIGVGTLASGLLVLSAGSALLIYEEAIAYQRCATEAITVSAQKACETDFEAARDERIAEIRRRYLEVLRQDQDEAPSAPRVQSS